MKRLKTIKQSVFLFAIVIVFCFLLGFFYTFYATNGINEAISEMFTTSITLQDMTVTMGAFESQIDTYLATKSSDSFVQYLNHYNVLQNISRDLALGKSSNSAILQLNNIHMMLDEYLKTASSAIGYKRARNTEKYLESFNTLKRISSYIQYKVNQVERWDFKNNIEYYTYLSGEIKGIQIRLVIMTIMLIFQSFMFVYSFSTSITLPIVSLSNRAYAISQGQYDFEPIPKIAFKEAHVLQTAFTQMSYSIKSYLGALEDKVETENKLRKAEIEQLKMLNLLNEAELKALQSQINPHFLFNTLNAGLQLAIIEDADRTSAYIEHLSLLFRYNIQSMNNKVKVMDEFQNIKNYAALMNVRFGDRIQFEFDMCESVAHFEMPPLIIQPIVENAIIHGFKNLLEGGRIVIRAFKNDNQVQIEVEDNGEGIPKEALSQLNHYDFSSLLARSGNTTGLGIGNVYDRLVHFYNVQQVMRFESVPHSVTRITLNLPCEEVLHENIGG